MGHSASRIASLAAVLLLATACSGDDGRAESKAASDKSSPAAGEESDSPCDLLSDDQVRDLTGTPLVETHETAIGKLPICVWGSLNDVGAHAGLVPASEWARALPGLVEQLEASGFVLDDENLRKLREAADLISSGSTIPAERACDLFGDLTELNGLPRGSDVTVNLVPSRDDVQGISGQACRDGRYATIALVRPDLTGSDDEQQRVYDAVEALVSRTAR